MLVLNMYREDTHLSAQYLQKMEKKLFKPAENTKRNLPEYLNFKDWLQGVYPTLLLKPESPTINA